ncbi:hypothetical protein KFL_002400160 [Klebsormidium nitens]|uniref:N-acetyltransferase domain-containing protein n=1 Tax=Klebsormidium nitens TaxID=105231 RepID=A0A1Y1I3N3_KLENI|nr:hypothetical protein KFL_002400160 [Klebsormidium nitens]|eukprot:GAQ85544.1 hypothetical protein KFL_002400160 [Klebsormidium nitens]
MASAELTMSATWGVLKSRGPKLGLREQSTLVHTTCTGQNHAHQLQFNQFAPWKAGTSRRNGRHRRPWTRCSTANDGQSSNGPSLFSLAAKGLLVQPLSLEEQVALEKQSEESRQPADTHSSSVPLSGLVKGRVLSLAEQVELEHTAGNTESATPGEAPRNGKAGTAFGLGAIEAPERPGDGNSKDAESSGQLSLSEVATGFGGRALSLEEQVELERQAEEQGNESPAGKPVDKGWERNGSGETGRGEGDGRTLQPFDERQVEIEAALGKKLQEVLREEGSLQQRPDDRVGPNGEASGKLEDLEIGRGVLSTGGASEAKSGSSPPPLEVSLAVVDSSQAEHALATLRAQVFYTYPDVGKMTAAQKVTARSEFRMKLKENMQEEKGMIDFFRAVKRPEHAVLALCDLPYYQSLLSEQSAPGQASEPDPFRDVILRPATLKRRETVTDGLGSFEVEHEMAVIATFALQVGSKLSGQNLVGAKPLEVPLQRKERGYLYSVCVLPTLQRRGLGRYLVEEAKSRAREMGIKHLYVHVELSNERAEKLYKETGFVTEQVETEELARNLKRPRRQMLWCEL